jgi:polysaccharide biosynthesis transport protein
MGPNPLVHKSGQITPQIPAVLPLEQQLPLGSNQYQSLGNESVLREYIRILLKRRWVIIAGVAVVFSLATIRTLRSPRIYEAGGSVAIAKTQPMLFNFQDSANSYDAYTDMDDLDTEARILQSDLLALQVIRELGLDKLPEFGGSPSTSPDSLELTTDELQPNSARTSAVLSEFKRRLTVDLVPNTRIIEIRFRSTDPQLAPRVVNTLMNTYVEQNFKTKYANTMQASDWLSKQLDDLRIRVEISQEKLVKYQKEHEIIGVDEKQNIITSKLDELNLQLTQAESDRIAKQATYQLVQSQDQETATAAVMSADSTQNGIQNGSTLFANLRQQEADLKIKVAQLSTQFGPAYPQVAQLNNQLREVEAQIHRETKNVLGRVRDDYMAALDRENMLKAALEQQKQEANKLNQSAIEYSLLKRDVDTNRTLYESLLEKLKEAGVSAGLKSTNFRTVDVARVPTVPVEPNVQRNLAAGFGLGLMGGIVLAFVLEGLDNTVRTPEQAYTVSALPPLGTIPLGSRNGKEFGVKNKLLVAASRNAVEVITQSHPQSQMAEAYRAMRTSLLLSSLGAPPKVILVTSALPQEGKTTTSINCAIVLAQKGSRVLLVDADLRRPGIHKALGMGLRSGLSNVLTGNASLQQAIIRSGLVPTLFVLPAGAPPPNPAELLSSTNMRELITQLREQYDHIVIDTPPALSVTDAVIVSTCADSVVLVIRSGQTAKHALRRARDVLVQVNARVSGVLMNAADLHSAEYYYYYGYGKKYGSQYYGDGGGDDEAENNELGAAEEAVRTEESPPQANSTSA